MKLIFKALLIAFLIGVALAILQLVLFSFGNYTIAVIFYYLILIPSALLTAVFKDLFGIDLFDNQILFSLITVVTVYLLFSFFIYCLLWIVKWINAPK
jgi:ABC-type proline/glycine betaine transport system permease subunit